jgi:hypothetical protein
MKEASLTRKVIHIDMDALNYGCEPSLVPEIARINRLSTTVKSLLYR